MRSDRTGGIGPGLVLRGAALCTVLGAASASAQISVGGGLQGVTSWPQGCAQTESFVNDTGIALAGLWIALENDGLTELVEIRDIVVTDLGATKDWDVDDDEDGDNDDAGEGDTVDSTPLTGLPLGWHRVQANTHADRILEGETFTITLCSSDGTSLSGQPIFLVPMAPLGTTGGDQSVRTEAPFSVSAGSPAAAIVIDGVNAPPGSETFTALCTNVDATKGLRKIRLVPPGAADIVVATATKGGIYSDGPPATILWPTPIATGDSVRITTTLSAFARRLTSTVGFVATGRNRM